MFSVEELVIQHRTQKVTVVNVKRRTTPTGRTDGMGILFMGYESVFCRKPPPWLRKRLCDGSADENEASQQLVSSGNNMLFNEGLQTILDTGAIKLVRKLTANSQSQLKDQLSVPLWVFANKGPNVYYPQIEGMKALEQDIDGDEDAEFDKDSPGGAVGQAPVPINKGDANSQPLDLNTCRQFSIVRYEDLSDEKKSVIMIQTPERESVHNLETGAKISEIEDGAGDASAMPSGQTMLHKVTKSVTFAEDIENSVNEVKSDANVSFLNNSEDTHFNPTLSTDNSQLDVRPKVLNTLSHKPHFDSSPESPKSPSVTSPTISKYLSRDNPQLLMTNLRENLNVDTESWQDDNESGELFSRCSPKAHSSQQDDPMSGSNIAQMKESRLKAKLADSALYRPSIAATVPGSAGDAAHLSHSLDMDSGIWDMIQGKDGDSSVASSVSSRDSTPVVHLRGDDVKHVTSYVSDIQELNINDMLFTANPLEMHGDKPSIAYRAFKVDVDANEVTLSKANVATYVPLLEEPKLSAITIEENEEIETNGHRGAYNIELAEFTDSENDDYISATENENKIPHPNESETDVFESALENALESSEALSDTTPIADGWELVHNLGGNEHTIKTMTTIAETEENNRGMVSECTQTSPIKQQSNDLSSKSTRRTSVNRQRSYAQAIKLENEVTSPDSESGWVTAAETLPKRVVVKKRKKPGISNVDQNGRDPMLSSSDFVASSSDDISSYSDTESSSTPTASTPTADTQNRDYIPKDMAQVNRNMTANKENSYVKKEVESDIKVEYKFPVAKRPVTLVTDIPNAIDLNEKHTDYVDSATKPNVNDDGNTEEISEIDKNEEHTDFIEKTHGEANVISSLDVNKSSPNLDDQDESTNQTESNLLQENEKANTDQSSDGKQKADDNISKPTAQIDRDLLQLNGKDTESKSSDIVNKADSDLVVNDIKSTDDTKQDSLQQNENEAEKEINSETDLGSCDTQKVAVATSNNQTPNKITEQEAVNDTGNETNGSEIERFKDAYTTAIDPTLPISESDISCKIDDVDSTKSRQTEVSGVNGVSDNGNLCQAVNIVSAKGNSENEEIISPECNEKACSKQDVENIPVRADEPLSVCDSNLQIKETLKQLPDNVCQNTENVPCKDTRSTSDDLNVISKDTKSKDIHTAIPQHDLSKPAEITQETAKVEPKVGPATKHKPQAAQIRNEKKESETTISADDFCAFTTDQNMPLTQSTPKIIRKPTSSEAKPATLPKPRTATNHTRASGLEAFPSLVSSTGVHVTDSSKPYVPAHAVSTSTISSNFSKPSTKPLASTSIQSSKITNSVVENTQPSKITRPIVETQRSKPTSMGLQQPTNKTSHNVRPVPSSQTDKSVLSTHGSTKTVSGSHPVSRTTQPSHVLRPAQPVCGIKARSTQDSFDVEKEERQLLNCGKDNFRSQSRDVARNPFDPPASPLHRVSAPARVISRTSAPTLTPRRQDMTSRGGVLTRTSPSRDSAVLPGGQGLNQLQSGHVVTRTATRPSSMSSKQGIGLNQLSSEPSRKKPSFSLSLLSPSSGGGDSSESTSPAHSRGRMSSSSSRGSQSPYFVASYSDGTDWGDESLLWDADDDDDTDDVTNMAGDTEAELGDLDSNPDWMSELPARLHDMPLTALAIPGSHISLAIERDMKTDMDIAKSNYEMAEFLRKLPNLSIFNNFRSLIKQIWKAWMPKQTLSVTSQLHAGVRYLDIRVTKYRSALYAEHGLYSKPIIKYLKHVKLFLDAHPREVVILHFNALNQIDTKDKRRLVTSLFQIFGARMAKVTTDLNKVTLNQLWRRKKQVIIVFPQEDTQVLHNHIFVGLIWPDSVLSTQAPKAQTKEELRSFLDSTYYTAQSMRSVNTCFRVTRAVLSPDMSMLFGEYQYQSMRQLTLTETHVAVSDWLQHKTNLNIVAFDFVGANNVIENIIRLNDFKGTVVHTTV